MPLSSLVLIVEMQELQVELLKMVQTSFPSVETLVL